MKIKHTNERTNERNHGKASSTKWWLRKQMSEPQMRVHRRRRWMRCFITHEHVYKKKEEKETHTHSSVAVERLSYEAIMLQRICTTIIRQKTKNDCKIEAERVRPSQPITINTWKFICNSMLQFSLCWNITKRNTTLAIMLTLWFFMLCTGFAINIRMISIETLYNLNCCLAQDVEIVG